MSQPTETTLIKSTIKRDDIPSSKDDPYDSAIKQYCTKLYYINNNCYSAELKFYIDGVVVIELEECVTKIKYRSMLTAKEIHQLTSSQIPLLPDQFYNILVLGLERKDNNIKLDFMLNSDNTVTTKLVWNIPVSSNRLPIEFVLTLKNVELKDIERMDRMMREFKIKSDKLEETIKNITEKYNELLPKLEIQQKSNIVNVSVFEDKARRLFENPAMKVEVNKKLPNSTLLVHATLCVHGETHAELCAIWTLGKNKKTIAYGQTENYMKNDGYGRVLTSVCLFKDHAETGPQELTLTFENGMKPFTLINPNKSDSANFKEGQTCSIIRVEELLLTL